ncbi:hypothetical protein ACFZAV_45365 [Streptomyces sp. NPDC008343]|uniref:hypothetical protein n=1 Tax=Streptomyces sp. NPDC008343 TaxID=3364828 RepID=UPI0036DFBE28
MSADIRSQILDTLPRGRDCGSLTAPADDIRQNTVRPTLTAQAADAPLPREDPQLPAGSLPAASSRPPA